MPSTVVLILCLNSIGYDCLVSWKSKKCLESMIKVEEISLKDEHDRKMVD